LVLATNRNGYGNLSELITLARTWADKGQYFIHFREIIAPSSRLQALLGLSDC
jgi:error-prone DNA polymerase